MAQRSNMGVVAPILMFTAVAAFGVGGYMAFANKWIGVGIGVIFGGLVGLLEVKFLEKLFAKSRTDETGHNRNGIGS